MTDFIIKTKNGSIYQIGNHNKRIYVIKMSESEPASWIDEILRLAQEQNCEKVFCKISASKLPLFLIRGFVQEAYIPNYFMDDDALFVSRFFNDRAKLSIKEKAALNELALPLSSMGRAPMAPAEGYEVTKLSRRDACEMAVLFKEVFQSYPFPVFDPNYIVDTMKTHITYFGVKVKGKLVAVASAEVDHENNTAEMTDFAIHPSYRGRRLSEHILTQMELWARENQLKVLFTIARLNSLPINKTFIRQGYTYTGTLVNNTNISGHIESMNVYYKIL